MGDYQISGRTVLVTGAGRGLGKALVSAFAREGATVIAISRSVTTLTDLTDEYPERVICYEIDVTDHAEITRVVDKVAKETGGLDILFNNAAVYPKVNFLDESAEEWLSAVNIGLGGVAICCKAVLPHMVRARAGKIYNVGSWADIAPALNSSAYSTAKGGLHALTRSIGTDIEPLNTAIEVHEWIPGHLNTQMSDFTGIDPAISASWAVQMVQATASKKNSVFENDREWFPPKGLKARLKEKLFFWR